MQPRSQQGANLGVGGPSQGVLAAAIPWAPVAAAAGLIGLCAQAVKDNTANKQQVKAVHQEDIIEEFQEIVKVEEARPVPYIKIRRISHAKDSMPRHKHADLQ